MSVTRAQQEIDAVEFTEWIVYMGLAKGGKRDVLADVTAQRGMSLQDKLRASLARRRANGPRDPAQVMAGVKSVFQSLGVPELKRG